MSPEPEIQQALRRLTSVFDAMNVPYAVGGAVGMAFVGFVRATRDVDVLALVPAVGFQNLAERLAAEGFVMRDAQQRPSAPDAARLSAACRDFGHFRVWLGDTKAEIFLPKVPLQDSVLRRRVRVEAAGLPLWITTAEDLILMKMIFHRPKDLEDVRRLLAANRGELDAGYIRSWASKTLDATCAAELLGMLGRAASPG